MWSKSTKAQKAMTRQKYSDEKNVLRKFHARWDSLGRQLIFFLKEMIVNQENIQINGKKVLSIQLGYPPRKNPSTVGIWITNNQKTEPFGYWTIESSPLNPWLE